MLDIHPTEQQHCHVVLQDAFPGIDVEVRSHLFPQQKRGQSLVVIGREEVTPKLLTSLRLLLNKKRDDYVWDSVVADEDDPRQIKMHFSDLGILLIPRFVLIETIFRRDVIKLANLCLSRRAVMKVTRPSGEILSVPVDLPVPPAQNGRVILGQPLA